MEPQIDFSQITFQPPPDEKELKKDPAPKNKPVRKATSSGPGRPTKQSKINEMKDEIKGLILMLALPLKMRDMHPDGSSCADIFVEYPSMELTKQADAFAEQLAIVGVDNKFITRFFEMGESTTKWLMLAMTAQPLVMAVVMNHRGGGYVHPENQLG